MAKRVNEIEAGIPVPNWHRRGRWLEILLKMKKGDSTIVDSYNEATALRCAGLRNGVKMRLHKTEKGIRVWRLN